MVSITATLLKKDYKIIGTSTKNPQRVIVEMDKNTLDTLTSHRRVVKTEVSLRDYVTSGEVNNRSNISKEFGSVESLISSMR